MSKPFAIPLTIAFGSAIAGVSLAMLAMSRAPRTATLIVLLSVGGVAAIVLLAGRHAGSAAAVLGGEGLASVALLVWTTDESNAVRRRELVGVMAFHSLIASASVLLMLVARLGVMQAGIKSAGESTRSAVQEFFTPTPPLPATP